MNAISSVALGARLPVETDRVEAERRSRLLAPLLVSGCALYSRVETLVMRPLAGPAYERLDAALGEASAMILRAVDDLEAQDDREGCA